MSAYRLPGVRLNSAFSSKFPQPPGWGRSKGPILMTALRLAPSAARSRAACSHAAASSASRRAVSAAHLPAWRAKAFTSFASAFDAAACLLLRESLWRAAASGNAWPAQPANSGKSDRRAAGGRDSSGNKDRSCLPPGLQLAAWAAASLGCSKALDNRSRSSSARSLAADRSSPQLSWINGSTKSAKSSLGRRDPSSRTPAAI
mmetsp:Transcript_41810/g.126574  ORF Transcript_41810/g.126574 Transcript_41810/m.126574 type:complete len:203 (-) Transcript_41810:148-756(-)